MTIIIFVIYDNLFEDSRIALPGRLAEIVLRASLVDRLQYHLVDLWR